MSENSPSFVMGIVAFATVIMLLFPAFFSLFLNPIPENQKKELNTGNIFETDKEGNIKPLNFAKTFKILFTFDAENYGMTPLMSKVSSSIMSICLYSGILALASIYSPLFGAAGVVAIIQSYLTTSSK